MTVRAKFKLSEITSYASGPGKRLTFRPEYDTSIPEDARFAKYTPNGEFWMFVDNPAALEQLEINKQYYLDITPAT